jgi:hypothetical protein
MGRPINRPGVRLAPCSPAHRDDVRRLRLTVARPCHHQLAAFLKGVATSIGSLDGITHEVRQGCLSNLTRERRAITTPLAEAAPEAMHGRISPETAQDNSQRVPRDGPISPLAGENIVGDPGFRHLPQDRHATRAQWHLMLAATFHPRPGNGPDLGLKINLGPSSAQHLARARCRQDGTPGGLTMRMALRLAFDEQDR